ncbi:lysophospholipase L1-like esterase [Sphingomonas prati]|uniref:Lysophospholipase L1-like esterase n=1 Tax=Sphingomonas prati TaxID=1843237 RepID=A0A7W9BQF4_9SPHN|nr:lysophospholipase L1-like esterase [Sphingomonas prati]
MLMAAGQSGPIYGPAGAGFVTAQSVTLPPNTIVGGCTLRLRLLLAKYVPFGGGHKWRMRIGNLVVAQNDIGASLLTTEIEHLIRIANDRKSAFVYNTNSLDTPSLAAGNVASTGAKTGSTASLGARQPSSYINFVSNSAPPTGETVLVDFAQPVTVSLDVQVVNGDTMEVIGSSLEMLTAGSGPSNVASPRATAIWGDSLTEGTGAVAVSNVPMDVTAQLRRQRPGWPIASKGLGGQKSATIVDRLIADQVAGRQWNAVLWIGTNDFDDNVGNGPGWLAAIRAQVDRALAYRTNSSTLVCNMYPRAGWAVGDVNYVAMQQVNAGLVAAYGGRVVDLFAALATDNGKLPTANLATGDAIHLSNDGYTAVMQSIHARMTALNWN